MKHLVNPCLATAVLCSMAIGAHAQTVYRCGNTYTQSPCPQGRLVDASDPRTEAQRSDALRVAADERRLAAEMASDRRAEMAATRPIVLHVTSKGRGVAAPSATGADPAQLKKGKSARMQAATSDLVAQVPGSRPRRSRT